VSAVSLRGRLLIATPILADGVFDRTIVVLVEDTSEGSAGLVLNRPSPVPLVDALPDLAAYVSPPAVVFVGGPVGQESAIGLARAAPTEEGPPEGWSSVKGDVGTFDFTRFPEGAPPWVSDLRVFAGYAGWSPGQLAGEIDAGAWIVADAEPEDLISPDPAALWRDVLRRQRGETAWLANYPEDPTTN
jgi:putative transcriptional regulator